MTTPEWIVATAAAAGVAADDLARLTAMAAPGDAAALLSAARFAGIAADADAVFAAAMTPPGRSGMDLAAALTMACFSAVRRRFAARPDAIAARVALSGLADVAYAAIGEGGEDALAYCAALAGAAIVHLSRTAASATPVVMLETGIAMPSSLLAFDLYGDPARGGEIVERNRAATPMLMPTRFEALAS